MGAAVSVLVTEGKPLAERKKLSPWPQRTPETFGLCSCELNIAFVGDAAGKVIKEMLAKSVGENTQPKCYVCPEVSQSIKLWKFQLGYKAKVTTKLLTGGPSVSSFRLNEFDGVVVLIENQLEEWQISLFLDLQQCGIPVALLIYSNALVVEGNSCRCELARDTIGNRLPHHNNIFIPNEGREAAAYLSSAIAQRLSQCGLTEPRKQTKQTPTASFSGASPPYPTFASSTLTTTTQPNAVDPQLMVTAFLQQTLEAQGVHIPRGSVGAVGTKRELESAAQTKPMTSEPMDIEPASVRRASTTAETSSSLHRHSATLPLHADVSLVPPPAKSNHPRSPVRGHIGIAGAGQVGKSSLINSLLNIPEGHPNAAPVTEDGSQQGLRSYKSRDGGGPTYFEIPYAHLHEAKLSEMSAVCVLIGDRFLTDDFNFVQKLNLDEIPFFLIRTKVDMGVMQVKRKQRTMSDEEAKVNLRKEVIAILHTTPIGTFVPPDHILFVSAWKIAENKPFMDEGQLIRILETLTTPNP